MFNRFDRRVISSSVVDFVREAQDGWPRIFADGELTVSLDDLGPHEEPQ